MIKFVKTNGLLQVTALEYENRFEKKTPDIDLSHFLAHGHVKHFLGQWAAAQQVITYAPSSNMARNLNELQTQLNAA
jgi:hypothetical protein